MPLGSSQSRNTHTQHRMAATIASYTSARRRLRLLSKKRLRPRPKRWHQLSVGFSRFFKVRMLPVKRSKTKALNPKPWQGSPIGCPWFLLDTHKPHDKDRPARHAGALNKTQNAPRVFNRKTGAGGVRTENSKNPLSVQVSGNDVSWTTLSPVVGCAAREGILRNHARKPAQCAPMQR